MFESCHDARGAGRVPLKADSGALLLARECRGQADQPQQRESTMIRRLTAIVEREGEGYVALCPEVDVASQGASVVEARDNLAEALALLFEAAPGEEVDRRLRGEVYVTQIEVAVG